MSRIDPWRELATEHVVDCKVFAVERSLAISPDDEAEHAFYRIRSQDFVQIVPVTRAGSVVMVRQYRHGARAVTLEVPGGLVDPGEAPEATAARECLEETGYEAARPRLYGTSNPNPALFGNRMHSFYALDVEQVGEIRNTSSEHTEVELVPLERLPELLRDGTIQHALIAYTLYRFLSERAAGRIG